MKKLPSVSRSGEGVDLDHVLEAGTVPAVRYPNPHLQVHLREKISDGVMELEAAPTQQRDTQLGPSGSFSKSRRSRKLKV